MTGMKANLFIFPTSTNTLKLLRAMISMNNNCCFNYFIKIDIVMSTSCACFIYVHYCIVYICVFCAYILSKLSHLRPNNNVTCNVMIVANRDQSIPSNNVLLAYTRISLTANVIRALPIHVCIYTD